MNETKTETPFVLVVDLERRDGMHSVQVLHRGPLHECENVADRINCVTYHEKELIIGATLVVLTEEEYERQVKEKDHEKTQHHA